MCIMCLTHVAMPHYVLSAAKDATSAQFAGVQYRTMELGFGYAFTTSAWKQALFLSSTMKGFRKWKTMAILLAWMSSGCIHCSMLQSRTILLPLFATISQMFVWMRMLCQVIHFWLFFWMRWSSRTGARGLSGLETMRSKLSQLQKYLVDDFAATFGITNRTLLECLVFCLLDDHSSEALEEACSLLPKISSKETHPKIAQVLLERHKPDMALLVLKCTGRDSFSATENFEKDGISSLSEAVTVVRVRIECGLLTEAFMYHRSYCSKVKEQRSADVTHSEDAFKSSWIYHVEMMMTEFCTICIERNLVDKMIDLPWDSEEEKHLHKSLFESAHEMPMKPNGSLLVVYYLRRYRYLEAYEVDRSLQKFEQKKLENTTEEIASKIRAIAQWRESLIAKCLDMLPEVQREIVKAINSGEQSQFARTAQISSPAHVGKSQNPVMDLSTTFTTVLQNKSSLLSKNNASTDSGGLTRSSRSEFGRKVPSVLQTRASPQGPPTSNMRSTAGGMFPTVGQNVESPFLRGAKDISSRKGESGFKKGIKYADHDPLPMYLNLSSGDTPTKDYRTSLLKTEVNKTAYFQGKDSVVKGEFQFGSRAEKPFILNGTGVGQNGLAKVSGYAGFREDYKVPTKENILSFSKKSSVDGAEASQGVSRWRSDESSEDEEERTNREGAASLVTRRRPRFSRR
uniref:ELYS-like domain-containing protein n=1 Tax=Saccharum hybrid cultivar R570 TaxID=131158 RepID=A0A0A1I5L4_9POAL|nr:Conserved hypothetical protein 10 [Saccharum hybrid cultivar R570]